MRRITGKGWGLIAAAALVAAPIATFGADEITLPHEKWSFNGPFGTFDRAAAQRGFAVYNQVCATCHSLRSAYFRDLEGIGFSPEQVKAIAASKQVPALDDSGQPTTRPGLPSDHFVSPFPNDDAAKAAMNGAIPPDQSLLVNARAGGPDYIYALLTGYTDPPQGAAVPEGTYYNKYFPSQFIKMPPPLSDDLVQYADGTKATVAQEAHDVTTFLTYIASPEMEQRKRMGVKVILFLIMMTGLVYAMKRKIWSAVH
ncbi:MAG TPA: cytochrome c1 [Acetobacteraceae bacterium]|nr:cytochrome c1 [Acetobacteraceae bacterium]